MQNPAFSILTKSSFSHHNKADMSSYQKEHNEIKLRLTKDPKISPPSPFKKTEPPLTHHLPSSKPSSKHPPSKHNVVFEVAAQVAH
jgi:hypothetical protein